jgi:polyisoprenoid-binding protein YceI
MKKIIACLLLFIIAVPAFAADQWKIVKESTIGFEGTQMGAPFKGSFKQFDGTIVFDSAHLDASKADITIQMNSVDATSKDRTEYLPNEPWFDVAKYPDAHFVTTSIEKAPQENHYIAKANLTIRDVTLPVTLPFTLVIKGNQAVMNGETTISRIDFGVGQGEWKDVSTVGANVKVTINVTATR